MLPADHHFDLENFLEDLNEVHFCESRSTEDNLQDILDDVDDGNDIKLIICNKISRRCSPLAETVTLNDASFELRTIIGSRTLGHNFKWKGHIYSRHGGLQYSGWWFNSTEMNIPIQIDSLPDSLPYNNSYTFAYVCVENPNFSNMRNKFLQNLGGQSHVQCAKHKLPLIASTTRIKKCQQCGKKEFYRCCDLSCNCVMCKKCVEALDINDTTFITPREGGDDSSASNDDDLDNDGDDLNEPHRLDNDNDSINDYDLDNDDLRDGFVFDDMDNGDYDVAFETGDNTDSFDDMAFEAAFLNNMDNGDNTEKNTFDDMAFEAAFLNGDNMDNGDNAEKNTDDFLTTSLDVDFPISEDDDIGLNRDDEGRVPNVIPTTNAGDIAFVIEEQTRYGGSCDNITVAGHVLLNQCGTLLTRKEHQIKGSSKHNFF